MTTLLSIAIVDDYPRWRNFLNAFLTKQGFSTFCKAANGKELLLHLEQSDNIPSLCMLDVSMPEMDGFETAQVLRAKYPTIKILAFSMSVGRGTVNRILDCGAHAFLAKGVAPNEIKDALLKLLEPQSTPKPFTKASNSYS